jgi:hypothetical protein
MKQSKSFNKAAAIVVVIIAMRRRQRRSVRKTKMEKYGRPGALPASKYF